MYMMYDVCIYDVANEAMMLFVCLYRSNQNHYHGEKETKIRISSQGGVQKVQCWCADLSNVKLSSIIKCLV